MYQVDYHSIKPYYISRATVEHKPEIEHGPE